LIEILTPQAAGRTVGPQARQGDDNGEDFLNLLGVLTGGVPLQNGDFCTGCVPDGAPASGPFPPGVLLENLLLLGAGAPAEPVGEGGEPGAPKEPAFAETTEGITAKQPGNRDEIAQGVSRLGEGAAESIVNIPAENAGTLKELPGEFQVLPAGEHATKKQERTEGSFPQVKPEDGKSSASPPGGMPLGPEALFKETAGPGAGAGEVGSSRDRGAPQGEGKAAQSFVAAGSALGLSESAEPDKSQKVLDSFPRAQAERIEQALGVLVHRGGGSMRIRLHPPELGNLHIHVSVTNDGVRVRFGVERSVTQNLLVQSMPELREQLLRSGFTLTGSEVVLTGQGGASGDTGGAWGGAGGSAGEGSQLEEPESEDSAGVDIEV